MLKNITLGQYYPVDSAVHRLDPRTKLLLVIAFIIGIFLIKTLAGYAVALGFIFLAAHFSKVPWKLLLKT